MRNKNLRTPQKNPKHEKFVLEYLKDFNGARAYKTVYKIKKENTAKAAAWRLLQDSEIKRLKKEFIEKILDDQKEDLRLRTISELQQLSFSRLTDYIDKDGEINIEKLRQLNPGSIREIIKEEKHFPKLEHSEITYRIKLGDKNKPLEVLARYLGLVEEKTQGDVYISFGKEEDL